MGDTTSSLKGKSKNTIADLVTEEVGTFKDSLITVEPKRRRIEESHEEGFLTIRPESPHEIQYFEDPKNFLMAGSGSQT